MSALISSAIVDAYRETIDEEVAAFQTEMVEVMRETVKASIRVRNSTPPLDIRTTWYSSLSSGKSVLGRTDTTTTEISTEEELEAELKKAAKDLFEAYD
jgi:hypothetical protein